MPASAHDVAAAIRRRLPGAGVFVVHKLMYFAQGHHLAWFGEPLFDEPIEAWIHGPVVADLWRAEKYNEPPETINDLDNRELNTIGYVVSRYGNNVGHDLETLTHNEGPWREAFERKQGGLHRHTMFSDAMQAFFLEVHERDRAEDEFRFDQADIDRIVATAQERLDAPASTRDTRESLLARLRG